MKILHTADIHLGSNAYGRIDPQTGRNTRLEDFRRCFEFMVERGLSEDIDVFLFCGDAYRTADPTPTQQKVFAECLKPIADRKIPILMVTGNHDHPVSFGKASSIDIFDHLSGDVRIYRRSTAETIDTNSGPLQLLAMPWPVRSVLLFGKDYRKKSPEELCAAIEQNYIAFIRDQAAKFLPSLPTVLAGHFSVPGSILAGSERTSLIAHEPKFTPAQLSVPPIDYVALGHIHFHQNCATDPEAAPVVYSSSIERVTFKEWNNPKGFVLVSIDGSPTKATYEFVETPARRFESIWVDARKAPDPTAAILKKIEDAHVKDAVARVRFQIDEAQRAQVDMQRIREALKRAFAIASIERTANPVERKHRTEITGESNLREAMAGYIDQHEHLAPIKAELIEKALALEAEYEATRLAQE